jgi:hypothetical protein
VQMPKRAVKVIINIQALKNSGRLEDADKIIISSKIEPWKRHGTISQNHLHRFPGLAVLLICLPPGKLQNKRHQKHMAQTLDHPEIVKKNIGYDIYDSPVLGIVTR